MARIFVEGWDPDYGTPLDQSDDLAPAEGTVDPTVEIDDWGPIEGVDDGVDRIAFVDGVRRIDARLTLDDPVGGPTPGLVGTFAVGAVVWHRGERRSEVTDVRIERWAVLAGGSDEQMPAVDLEPGVGTTRTAGDDASLLMMTLHSKMRDAEGECAEALSEHCAVIADGPLKKVREHATVGYVKTHRVTYLEPEHNGVVAELAPGQRTPLFCLASDTPYARYAWYLRLAVLQGGHSWTGVVRCETSAHLPVSEAAAIADRTAAVLPIVASEPQVDPRAPQNLVPIGALERELRHRMGDRGLVYRALRHAVMQPGAERAAS
ncbi:MAG TPA: hypothetical protein VF351_01265 [Actinomycetota bacterium]